MSEIEFCWEQSQFGAPSGEYRGEFLGVADLPEAANGARKGRDGSDMGPAVRWEFRITQGEYSGRVVSRISPKKVTANNICSRLLRGVLGRELSPGEKLRVSQCVGQPYTIS